MNHDWKRLEQDSVGLKCEDGCAINVHVMNSSCTEMVDSSGNNEEENGDTDWYCPENILPRDGAPVYLKMQVVFKAWYTPDCKISKWILENQYEADGKILAWQHRKGKNFHDREQ